MRFSLHPDLRQRRSGTSLPPVAAKRRCEHVVREGDTLWSIAASTLRTDDAERIARYWPRLHRANRGLIGRNPDLILPGQVLDLPGECDA